MPRRSARICVRLQRAAAMRLPVRHRPANIGPAVGAKDHHAAVTGWATFQCGGVIDGGLIQADGAPSSINPYLAGRPLGGGHAPYRAVASSDADLFSMQATGSQVVQDIAVIVVPGPVRHGVEGGDRIRSRARPEDGASRTLTNLEHLHRHLQTQAHGQALRFATVPVSLVAPNALSGSRSPNRGPQHTEHPV